jgi:hypothetical protein
MSNKKFLLIVSLVFGLAALVLWVLRIFNDIEIVYPICCNLVQFVAVWFLNKSHQRNKLNKRILKK